MAAVSIEALPQDDILYVIWSYGPVKKNTGLATDIPLVKVFIRAIENGELSTKKQTRNIGLPDLNVVRIGSLWQNRKRVEGYWEKYNYKYAPSLAFNFDFRKSRPRSIIYAQDKSNPSNKYEFHDYDVNSKPDPSKFKLHHSTSTLLVSTRGINIIVPSIELFNSTYVPRHKLIKSALATSNFEQVLDKYILDHKCSKTTYWIKLDKAYEDETMVFLAYLACNPTTRANVSKVYASLSAASTLEKLPIVLPYHPGKMSFDCAGLWINSDTFLVHRINSYDTPEEVMAEAEYPVLPVDSTVDKSKEPRPRINNQEIQGNPVITHEVNPNAETGVKYVISEVLPKTSSKSLKTRPYAKKVNNAAPSQLGEVSGQIDRISSGLLKSGSETKGVGRTNYQLVDGDIQTTPPLMEEIETVLHELQSEGEIIQLSYVDSAGNEYASKIYCSFDKKHINLNDNGFWASGYIKGSQIPREQSGFRKLLIAKITLKDATSFYYLEIVRKVKSDSFYGVFFKPSAAALIQNDIDAIKHVIASNRGHFDGKNLLPFPIENASKFKHTWGGMKVRFLTAFQKIKEKGLFT